jgi:hypothetical protein
MFTEDYYYFISDIGTYKFVQTLANATNKKINQIFIYSIILKTMPYNNSIINGEVINGSIEASSYADASQMAQMLTTSISSKNYLPYEIIEINITVSCNKSEGVMLDNRIDPGLWISIGAISMAGIIAFAIFLFCCCKKKARPVIKKSMNSSESSKMINN